MRRYSPGPGPSIPSPGPGTEFHHNHLWQIPKSDPRLPSPGFRPLVTDGLGLKARRGKRSEPTIAELIELTNWRDGIGSKVGRRSSRTRYSCTTLSTPMEPTLSAILVVAVRFVASRIGVCSRKLFQEAGCRRERSTEQLQTETGAFCVLYSHGPAAIVIATGIDRHRVITFPSCDPRC